MKELIHKDGNITIFGRDSQVMCEVSDNKVDAIITSPPYNTNQKYWGKVKKECSFLTLGSIDKI